MDFFRLDQSYIDHLRQADGRVYENKARRPYIGVIFSINGVDYLAPLTSKIKYQDHNQSIFNIRDGDQELGAIHFNNMVPVFGGVKSLVNFDDEEERYARLLRKQRRIISANEEAICRKAEAFYRLVVSLKSSWAIAISCDFPALELAAQNY